MVEQIVSCYKSKWNETSFNIRANKVFEKRSHTTARDLIVDPAASTPSSSTSMSDQYASYDLSSYFTLSVMLVSGMIIRGTQITTLKCA
jgi:hypothetical protein